MLVCISANPAIDRRLLLENIAVGDINRTLATPSGLAKCMADVPGRVDALDVQRLAQEIAVQRAVACESSRHLAVEAQ